MRRESVLLFGIISGPGEGVRVPKILKMPSHRTPATGNSYTENRPTANVVGMTEHDDPASLEKIDSKIPIRGERLPESILRMSYR
jgi:hypothetical protein